MLLGQFAEETAAGDEGDGVAAGVDEFAQQAGAEAEVVNAQALVLRGKKPAGSGCNKPGAAARRCPRPRSAGAAVGTAGRRRLGRSRGRGAGRRARAVEPVAPAPPPGSTGPGGGLPARPNPRPGPDGCPKADRRGRRRVGAHFSLPPAARVLTHPESLIRPGASSPCTERSWVETACGLLRPMIGNPSTLGECCRAPPAPGASPPASRRGCQPW